MQNPLDLEYIDLNTISQFINRDHKTFYSEYSIDKNWVSFIQNNFKDCLFTKSLIIKITNNTLIYDQEFNIEDKDKDKSITCFILEIRSDLIAFKHLNAIIIDNNKVYRYEPYGSMRDIEKLYNYKIVDAFLEQFFNKYQYIGPMSYQKTVGPQSSEELQTHMYSGFCSLWSLMFIHLILLNRDKNPEEIDNIMCSIYDHKNKIFAYVTYLVELKLKL